MAVKPKRRYCAALPAATTSCSSLSVTPFAYVTGALSPLRRLSQTRWSSHEALAVCLGSCTRGNMLHVSNQAYEAASCCIASVWLQASGLGCGKKFQRDSNRSRAAHLIVVDMVPHACGIAIQPRIQSGAVPAAAVACRMTDSRYTGMAGQYSKCAADG